MDASIKGVTLVGILDRKHGSIPVTINGRREKRCSIVPSITCEEHFLIADHACKEFFEGEGTVLSVALDPRGKNPTKAITTRTGESYVKLLEEALGKIDGTSISKADYDLVIPLLDAAAASVTRGEVRKAIEMVQKAGKTAVERLQRMTEERLNEINAQGEGQVDEARQLLEKDPTKAREILRRVASQYPPLACAKKAEELLKAPAEKGR
ncbi:MAG TPA: hypothetical protein VK661_03305 [Planctomycetota bacterium]|nr:hypothetical protein [Planctomycetota bacterium]